VHASIIPPGRGRVPDRAAAGPPVPRCTVLLPGSAEYPDDAETPRAGSTRRRV